MKDSSPTDFTKIFTGIFQVVYWLLVVYICVRGLQVRFEFPAMPFNGSDSGGYMLPVISKLSGGPFTHVGGRAFVYPLFLYGIVSVFKNFAFISYIQHLLGIVTALLALFSWRELKHFLSVRRFTSVVYDVFGLVLLALCCFSSITWDYEHGIMPESIFPFFSMCLVLLSIKLFKNAWSGTSAKKITLLIIVLLYLNFLLPYIRPHWTLTQVLVLFVVSFITIKYLRDSLIRKFLILLIPIALSFVTLYFPEKNLKAKYEPELTYASSHLLINHINLISDVLREDIADPAFQKYDKKLLQEVQNRWLEEERRLENGGRASLPVLGFDFNGLMWSDTNIMQIIRKNLGNKAGRINEFNMYYYKKMILQRPLPFSNKVFKQLGVYYGFNANLYSGQRRFEFKPDLLRSLQFFETFGVNKLSPEYMVDSVTLGTGKKTSLYAFRGLSKWHIFLSKLFPFLLFVNCMVTAFLFYLKAKSFEFEKLFNLSQIYFFCVSLGFGINFMLSFGHNLEGGRHIWFQYPITFLVEFMGIWILASFMSALYGRRFKKNQISSVISNE